jgi:NADP-dependent 3-hydroxy acid dehydrogenase YdfG
MLSLPGTIALRDVKMVLKAEMVGTLSLEGRVAVITGAASGLGFDRWRI